jgi:hypothetical protein
VGAAKQLFESSNQQDVAAKYSARFSKLENKPTVTGSAMQQTNKPAETGEKKAPWARPQAGDGAAGKPSWVTLAQVGSLNTVVCCNEYLGLVKRLTIVKRFPWSLLVQCLAH